MTYSSEPAESAESSSQPREVARRRDIANWAKPVSKLVLGQVPDGAVNLNVDGRRVNGPNQGFGQFWQKTYRVPLEGVEVTPAEVISAWKANFPSFWPKGNWFYAPLTGVAPGEVVLINSNVPGGVRLSTGVLVIYSDDESFTFMTPQGHPFAGFVTFCAFERDGLTVAQAQVLLRANDPFSELTLMLGAHKEEDKLWKHTLGSVARYFGSTGQVEVEVLCLDPKRQWSKAGNIWHNAAIRSGLYQMAMLPLKAFRLSRRIVRLVRQRNKMRTL